MRSSVCVVLTSDGEAQVSKYSPNETSQNLHGYEDKDNANTEGCSGKETKCQQAKIGHISTGSATEPIVFFASTNITIEDERFSISGLFRFGISPSASRSVFLMPVSTHHI